MNINHSNNFLRVMPTVNLSDNDISTHILGKIQSISNSSDTLVASTSNHAQTYKECISSSLLRPFQDDPSFAVRCISELDTVARNVDEEGKIRLKCEMVKMLLMETPLQKVFGLRTALNRRYKAHAILSTPDRLILMLEYYLLGGVTLLRGLRLRSYSLLYPALTMHSILAFFEQEKDKAGGITSGFRINAMLHKAVLEGRHIDGIDIINIPSARTIDRFIADCGYKKNSENRWFFKYEAMHTQAAQSSSLPCTSADCSVYALETTERTNDSNGYASLMARLNDLAALQPSLKEVSEVIESMNDSFVQPKAIEECQHNDEGFLALQKSPCEFEVTSSSSSASLLESIPEHHISLKDHIAHLSSAIDNHAESEINKIKFNAVKMKLENFPDSEIKSHCNSLYTRNFRKINWNPERLKLITNYYLSGGLLMLRGFSFQTLPENITAKTMALLMSLVQKNPDRGSHTLLAMAKQLASQDAEIIFPKSTTLEKFIGRCGYQRIKRQWVFNPTLTPNIPSAQFVIPTIPYSQQQENTPEYTAKQTAKRKHCDILEEPPYLSSSEESLTIWDSTNLEFSSMLTTMLQDVNVPSHAIHLEIAANNDAEREIDRTKFIAIKMLLEGYSYGCIITCCSSLFFQNLSRKKLAWTNKKLDALLENYLRGGLLLVRGFSFNKLSGSIPAKTMALILNVLKHNLDKGSFAILKLVGEMNSEGSLDVDASNLPTCTALDHFLARCGYKRVEKQWVFNSQLTPNIPL